MAALPPVAAAASKPVVRTVITLVASVDCTVAMAFARVDGALEGVGRDDLCHIADLAHIELGRHAGGPRSCLLPSRGNRMWL